MDANVEKEMCNNCKKEIPQANYMMHTMHCAKNITLCKVCKEPIAKLEYENHREKCKPRKPKLPSPPPIAIEKSSYFQQRKAVEDQKAAARRENYLKKHEHMVDRGFTMKETINNGYSNSNSSSRNLSTSSSTGTVYGNPRNLGSEPSNSPAMMYGNPRNLGSQPSSNSPAMMYGNPRNQGSQPSSNSTGVMYGNPRNLGSQPSSNSTGVMYGNPRNLDSQPSDSAVKHNSSDSNQLSNTTQSGANNGAVKKPPLIPRLDDVGGAKPKGSKGLLPCRYCDLELPKLDLEEHENYCGSRTDKCLECGELVMFKNKQVHLDSNHGFVKLNDEPGPRPSWDSSTQRSSSTSNVDSSPTRRRFDRFRLADVDYDPTPYLPAAYQPGGGLKKNKEGESYKEISRRLDCKTEYIRNLLHDSASITIPLRSSGTGPRNHFNHNKGPAPQPPRRRRNPPTELTIPCEFCDTPIPHEELIEHETGCRPDLARFNPRRNRSSIPGPDEDDYFQAPRMRSPPRMRTPPRGDSPDSEELPCEFCEHMVPASQLWRHQLSCTPTPTA